jgi:branched-chain amino acid transport system substrate-binding protein
LQSGLKDQIPLYTAFTIDEITLPRQKEAAVGIPGAQEWVNDLPNEQNKRFVADYRKKHPGLSPTFYGAQTYDAAMLINSAVVATKGDLSGKEAVAQGRGKGRLRVRARQVQVRYQSHSDPELLLAGSHKGRGRLCAQNGRHHR